MTKPREFNLSSNASIIQDGKNADTSAAWNNKSWKGGHTASSDDFVYIHFIGSVRCQASFNHIQISAHLKSRSKRDSALATSFALSTHFHV